MWLITIKASKELTLPSRLVSRIDPPTTPSLRCDSLPARSLMTLRASDAETAPSALTSIASVDAPIPKSAANIARASSFSIRMVRPRIGRRRVALYREFNKRLKLFGNLICLVPQFATRL
jgi:hypothetical protein